MAKNNVNENENPNIVNKVNIEYAKEGEFTHANLYINGIKKIGYYTCDITINPDALLGLDILRAERILEEKNCEYIKKAVKNMPADKAKELAFTILNNAVEDYRKAVFNSMEAFDEGTESLSSLGDVRSKLKYLDSKDADFWLSFTDWDSLNVNTIVDSVKCDLRKRYKRKPEIVERFIKLFL